MPRDPFIVIQIFYEGLAAGLARTCLEAAGIECEIAEEHIAGMTELNHTPIGGVKLKVRRSHLDDAREILRTTAKT